MKDGKTIAERIRGYCDAAAADKHRYPTTIARNAENYNINEIGETDMLRAWADEIEAEIEAARQTPKWYEDFQAFAAEELERPMEDGESIKAWLERNYIAIPTDKDGRPWAIGDRCQPDGLAPGEVYGYEVVCGGRVLVTVALGDSYGRFDALALSRIEEDSQERIDEDARKLCGEYWACDCVSCSDCPAKVDGKSPWERYGTRGCTQAQSLDLLRRQRRLDGVSASC